MNQLLVSVKGVISTGDGEGPIDVPLTYKNLDIQNKISNQKLKSFNLYKSMFKCTLIFHYYSKYDNDNTEFDTGHVNSLIRPYSILYF